MEATPQKGFSLLEALIAITILAGVAMALAPAISAAAKVSTRIQQGSLIEEELRTTRRFLRDVFAQNILVDSRERQTAFKGSAKKITITTIDSATMSPVPVAVVISGGNQQVLTVRLGSSSSDDAQQYILIENLNNARFEFLDSQSPNPQWMTIPPSGNLPDMVRLAGQILAGNESKEFAFEFSLPGKAPLHCQFDSVSRRCR